MSNAELYGKELDANIDSPFFSSNLFGLDTTTFELSEDSVDQNENDSEEELYGQRFGGAVLNNNSHNNNNVQEIFLNLSESEQSELEEGEVLPDEGEVIVNPNNCESSHTETERSESEEQTLERRYKKKEGSFRNFLFLLS